MSSVVFGPNSRFRPAQSSSAPSSSGDAVPRQRGERARIWQTEALILIGVVAALTVIGLVFILSASSVFSLGKTHSIWTTFVRQLQWEVVGLVVLVATYRFGVSLLQKMIYPLVALSILLLLLVPLIGLERNGSTRWLGRPGLEIQPSELAKFAIVAGFAQSLTMRRKFNTAWQTLWPFGAMALGLLLPVLLQPDLGTSFVIAAAGLSVMFAAGVNGRWMGSIMAFCALGGLLSVRLRHYQWLRLTAFLNPDSPEAFHIRRSLAGISAGGVTGVGIGDSRSKWGFLPNAHTDFIYSVIAEEAGLLGALFVLSLFGLFAWVGLRIATRAATPFSRLVAFGITGWITAQAVANIAAVTGVAPVTGVPLPFVSQGGTAFVSLMAALGILLDIARRGVDPKQTSRRSQYKERVHPSQHKK